MAFKEIGKITESRYSRIRDKIITLDGIYNLAKTVQEEYSQNLEKDKYQSISFTAICFDDSRYESEDLSLFSKDSILNKKRVESINISYSSSALKLVIDIDLRHGNAAYDYGNSIRVKGGNSVWVNGIIKKLEETVSSFTPQNTFVRKYKVWLNIIFGLSLGWFFLTIYSYILSFIPFTPKKDTAEWIILLQRICKKYPLVEHALMALLGFPVTINPAISFTNKLYSLWPRIEIQIGPEHTFIESRRRRYILGAFVLVALPLLLSFISSFIVNK
ncbi:MAG: hypothetical protein JW867_00440 [Candidatus Omnitrophica bacterium]|nr:hypothetical protein [Candidatus Omnitrophota bacterium]